VIGGRHLVDGGVADNTAISEAVKAGASTIYVLASGYACSLPEPPRGALAIALQAITILVQRRLQSEVVGYRGEVDLRVVPPLCPLAISPVDFSHTADLIERAHTSTERWLDASADRSQAVELRGFHRH
jgi:NTE family protein